MKRLNILFSLCIAAAVLYGFKPEPGIGLNIGDKAPELEFTDPDGKTIKLSSLKGDIVLLDFWASWCRPCVMEMPNVVNAYNKYKDAKFKNAKGFSIYNVSLDKSHNSWVNAIAKYNLAWKEHVSDLKGWQSAAARTYSVRQIPSNFLLDANGVIIAKDLRGDKLHMVIDELVASL